MRHGSLLVESEYSVKELRDKVFAPRFGVLPIRSGHSSGSYLCCRFVLAKTSIRFIVLRIVHVYLCCLLSLYTFINRPIVGAIAIILL